MFGKFSPCLLKLIIHLLLLVEQSVSHNMLWIIVCLHCRCTSHFNYSYYIATIDASSNSLAHNQPQSLAPVGYSAAIETFMLISYWQHVMLLNWDYLQSLQSMRLLPKNANLIFARINALTLIAQNSTTLDLMRVTITFPYCAFIAASQMFAIIFTDHSLEKDFECAFTISLLELMQDIAKNEDTIVKAFNDQRDLNPSFLLGLPEEGVQCSLIMLWRAPLWSESGRP